jgi:hypothetical protein
MNMESAGKTLSIILVVIITTGLCPLSAKEHATHTLRITTINVWSGVDYRGILRFGEFESGPEREHRFTALLAQLRDLDSDIIFIQEANRVDSYSRRLADSLGMDAIHQVVNAGIKIGPVGLPSNFKEGMAILAHPDLRLAKADAWKLSGSPGIYSSALTIHFDETVFALVGEVFINDIPVTLVGVHMHAAPPDIPEIKNELARLAEEGEVSRKEYATAIRRWEKGRERRKREFDRLLDRLGRLPEARPVIVAGDFNASPDSPEVRHFITDGRFIDTYEHGVRNRQYTWDADENTNVRYSVNYNPGASGIDARSLLFAAGDWKSRRIDYIFLNDRFAVNSINHSAVVMDSVVNGVLASDHFGMFAEIDVSGISDRETDSRYLKNIQAGRRMDILPIVMYDTDIGFGYGGKGFFLNYFGLKESFDVVAFNSTKGERWYRFVYSMPDFELRQGRMYPLALDVIVDYDKWINNSFFGVGSRSRYGDREHYTREPFEVTGTFSRGFHPHVIGRLGVRYTSVRNFNVGESGILRTLGNPLNAGTVRYSSLIGGARFDTRNSFINPWRGSVVDGEVEYVPDGLRNNVSFIFTKVTLQHYMVLFYPRTVLASRVGLRTVHGDDLPIQTLASIGGNNTLRGYPQDRYLDKTAVFANAEIRFPLYRRFGGVVGYDAGTVSRSIGVLESSRIVSNPVIGLRYYMDTFVVRADVGFGKETTGVYFNFGHVF